MYKSGNVKVCVFEQGEDKGWGVQITADGQRACLMLDGEFAREVTVAEAGRESGAEGWTKKKACVTGPLQARGVARELGLPDLPYTNVSLGLPFEMPLSVASVLRTPSRGQRRTP